MSDVGAIAEAVGVVGKIIYEALHQNQKERIDEAHQKAVKDCVRFKECLLRSDIADVQLMLDGLMYGIKIDISSSERLQLENRKLGQLFDAYDLLGLYQRARGAEFAQAVCEIIQTTPKE